MGKKLLVNYNMDHLPDFTNVASYFKTTCQATDYSGLNRIIRDFDYLIPSVRFKLDRKLLMNAKNLKAISTPSTGTDHIDFKVCSDLGIEVFSMKNDTEFLSTLTATAELTFALILNLMRMIPSAFEHVLDGNWDSSKFCGRELQGKTLGILGFGRLGKIMSDYGKAFRMKIIVCDPYKSVNIDGIQQVDFDKLLLESDILSLHLHLDEKTKGLIGKQVFRKMKKGIIIINTSRGAIIDTPSLIEALEDGTVSAAGLDVIDNELSGNTATHPLVDYARTHKNMIITPHMAGVTVDSQSKAFIHALEKLIALDKLNNNTNKIL